MRTFFIAAAISVAGLFLGCWGLPALIFVIMGW